MSKINTPPPTNPLVTSENLEGLKEGAQALTDVWDSLLLGSPDQRARFANQVLEGGTKALFGSEERRDASGEQLNRIMNGFKRFVGAGEETAGSDAKEAVGADTDAVKETP